MKKIILVAAAALFTTGAFAQGIQYGVKAGANFANITNLDQRSVRTGFYAGVFGEYVVNDFVGVQAELLYSQMGAGRKVGGVKHTLANNYIVLPILAKLYVARGLSVNVGPQFGYLLNAQEKTKDSVLKSWANLKGAYNKFDVSAALGLNYTVSRHLDITARYNLGLTKIEKPVDVVVLDGPNVSAGTTKSLKNNVISVGLGYRF